jgi:autotransporter passenger strand-loop-strand repeat protein
VTSGGLTLGNTDLLVVSSGGVAIAVTVMNGGTADVMYGGVAVDIVVSHGKALVSSGGDKHRRGGQQRQRSRLLRRYS